MFTPDTALMPIRTGPRDLTGWHTVCRFNEIRPGHARYTVLNGVEIALARDGDDIYGVGARCPYREAPLSDGAVAEGRIVCPLHGCTFDLRSGISPVDPSQAIPTYEARMRGEWVDVNTDVIGVGPGVPDVYLGRWKRRRGTDAEMSYVHAFADGEPYSTSRAFADLGLGPRQPLLTHPPLPTSAPVDTSVVIGSRCTKPLQLTIPVLIGHISYGAISIEAKVALARGARQAGTAIGSGDGGAHGRERDAAGAYIVQVMPGEIPDSADDADALEVWLGEAGRPGQAVYLPSHKVSTDVGLHRNIPPTVEYRGPLPTIDPSALATQIENLRQAGGGIPVGAKIPAVNISGDLPHALDAGVDYVVIEGYEAGSSGGDGAELASLATSTLDGVREARKVLDSHLSGGGVTLLAAGGIRNAQNICSMLAAGADAAVIGTAALWAIGCQGYGACGGGRCPVGIATQDPELRLRLNPDISARKLASYLERLTDGVAEYCRILGYGSVGELRS